MSSDDFKTIGVGQKNGNEIFPVPFQGFSLCSGTGSQLSQRQFFAVNHLDQKLRMGFRIIQHLHAGIHGSFLSGAVISNVRQCKPLDAVEFFQKTGVDALAISYGTMHGASKGKDVKLRKEIAIAIRECMNHLGIFGALVSHGSSTVPKYIVDEINGLGGELTNTYGISIEELKSAIPCGISKINVDTDIRLAVTRNMKELFAKYPEKRSSSSIGAIYELLESKKNQFDPRVFLPPIMDTVMYGNIPDDDVAAIVDCVERGVREVVGTLIVQFGSFGKAPLVEQVSLDEMAERYKKMK